MGFDMTSKTQTDIVRKGWEALAAGEFDKLAATYAEDMVFVLPGSIRDSVYGG